MHPSGVSIFLLVLVTICGATNPGIRLRLTDKGLQYVASIGVEVLKEKLNKISIPNINGDADTPVGHISYALSSLKVTSFSLPSYALKPVPNVGLQLSVSGVRVALHGNWHYREDSWPHISDSGSFDVTASSISFSVSVKMGMDSKGHPTIAAAGCSCNIGSVDVDLHGGASWLYNLFKSKIGDAIKSALQGQLCSITEKAINDEGAKAVAKFPIVKALDKYSEINYSLVENPTPTSAFLDLFLKGEFQSVAHPSEAPFSPAPLPEDSSSQYMVYAWVTDYLINTAGLVYMQAGFMNRTVTDADLPKDFKYPLNTKTFKVIVPQLDEKYPDMPLSLKVYPTVPPALASDTAGVNVSIVGNIEFYVVQKDGSTVFAFSLGLKIAATAKVTIKESNLTVHTSFVKVDPKLVKSAIGDISSDIKTMQFFLNLFVDNMIIAQLNKYGDRGFPLPMIDGVTLVSPQISSGKHFILISSNVNYKPSELSEQEKMIKEFTGRKYIAIV